jgi:hypothetical protein
MKHNGTHPRRWAGTTGQKALRSLRRAVRNLRAENRRLGLPLIVWKDGKVQEAKA